MKKTTIALFLSALMLPFLSGCGEAKASAAGTYAFDAAATEKAAAAAAGGELTADAKMMMQVFKAMKGSITLKEDNTCVVNIEMMGQKQEHPGTYKLDGDKLSVTTKKGDKDETNVATIKDGTITMTEEKDGKTMTMVFVKEKKAE